ncbi:MAG TPA: DUF748 domain-containing protein, partial [Deltaproteobacteria bacterium]|nr:DUF748 domain-containing protein [Deltaproteobacteria bacterium]
MREKLKDAVLRIAGSKITIIAAVVLVLYALAGFLILPLSIERFLPPALEERLDSDITLEKVRINPFALTLEVSDFGIREPDGDPIAGFGRLFVNFQLSSLFRWALTFKELSLETPSINIVVKKDGSLNLARLAGGNGEDSDAGDAAPDETEETSKETPPLRMLVHNVAVSGGKIEVTDNRQSEPATASLHPLDIQLSGISTLPDREGDYFVAATGPDGALVEWSGRVSLHPFRSSGTLALRGLPLATPWEFFKSRLNIAPPEGKLDLSTVYAVDLSLDQPTAELHSSRIELSGLRLQLVDAEEAFLDLPVIMLGARDSELVGRHVSGVTLAVNGGKVDLVMDGDGVLNLQRIVASGDDGEPGSESAKPEDPDPAKKSLEEDAPPWTVDITEVILNGPALRFADRSRASDLSFSTEGVGLICRANVESGPAGIQVRVDDFGLNIRESVLGFAGAEKPAVEIGAVTLSGGAFDLADRSAYLSRLELTDGAIDVIRDRNGGINLLRLFETGAQGGNVSGAAAPAREESPWKYLADEIVLSEFKTAFTDETVHAGGPIVEMESISAKVSRFDGTAVSPFEAGLKIVQGGEINVSGNIDPVPGGMEAKLKVRDLALSTAQPYLADAADLTLDSGRFATEGDFRRSAKGELSYRGPLHISDLRVVGNSTGDTLVGWKKMDTEDFHLQLEPNNLAVKAVRLAGLEGKLIISDDGKVNVVEAFRNGSEEEEVKEDEKVRPEKPAPSSKQAGAAFPVKIGAVKLEDGTLQFADFSLRPQFATSIHSLNGTIANVASSSGARTRIDLEGRVDEYGTNEITGGINSFDPKEFTDIVMVFKNLDMTNFTPYSGKFAGR